MFGARGVSTLRERARSRRLLRRSFPVVRRMPLLSHAYLALLNVCAMTSVGFEPTTGRLGICCSIQLSYEAERP